MTTRTTVGLAIGTNPGGGTLTGGTAVTVSAGVATFAGLSINKTGTGYTLTASSTPASRGHLAAFNITPGAATQLVFVQRPRTRSAGSPISPPVTVAVEDANGNVETGQHDHGQPGHRDQPRRRHPHRRHGRDVSAGVATFAGLTINKTGTGYTRRPRARRRTRRPRRRPSTSRPVPPTNWSSSRARRTPPPADHHPPGHGGGRGRQRQRRDRRQHHTVSLAIGTNPGGGTLTGGSAVTVKPGVATFSGLSIDKAGTGYTLTATSTPSTRRRLDGLQYLPGTANHLAFIQGPTNTAAGSPSPRRSRWRSRTPAATSRPVTTPRRSAWPSGPTPAADPHRRRGRHGNGRGHLRGPLHQQGRDRLHAHGVEPPSYTSATSSTFNITPGTATQLAFVQQPDQYRRRLGDRPGGHGGGRGRQRQRRDRRQHHDRSSLAIGTNPGGGTLTGGRPSRSIRRRHLLGPLHQQGRDRLHADGIEHAVLHAATSSPFNITPGTATQLVFVQGPTTHRPGRPLPRRSRWRSRTPTATSRPATTPRQISLAIGTNPGGGTLTGGSAVTVASGIATFAGLSINKTGPATH